MKEEVVLGGRVHTSQKKGLSADMELASAEEGRGVHRTIWSRHRLEERCTGRYEVGTNRRRGAPSGMKSTSAGTVVHWLVLKHIGRYSSKML
jgi:hypothetical protein